MKDILVHVSKEELEEIKNGKTTIVKKHNLHYSNIFRKVKPNDDVILFSDYAYIYKRDRFLPICINSVEFTHDKMDPKVSTKNGEIIIKFITKGEDYEKLP